MRFIESNPNFPFSKAVVCSGETLETVLVAINAGETKPVEGGPAAEMKHIFAQLDELLGNEGLSRAHVVSARLYLEEVNRDIAEVNEVWKEYFGDLKPNRRAYGVDLQVGMLVEACFVAEYPDS